MYSKAFNVTKFSIIFLVFATLMGCKEDAFQEQYLPKYEAIGEYDIEVQEVTDSKDVDYRVYYPKNDVAQLPIIVWGNGTDAQPDNYHALFEHFSSHGFVVIDTYAKNTGTGEEINEAINTIAALNNDTSFPLYQRLNTSNIGLAGHSQGSTGVINCFNDFENSSSVKTVVSIALPALYWCDPEDKYDTSLLTVPFMVLGGTKDFVISPTSTNEEAFDKTQDIATVMAMVKKAGHIEIQGDGGDHRALLTAWLSMQLKNDEDAAMIFRGQEAEVRFLNRVKSIAIKNL